MYFTHQEQTEQIIWMISVFEQDINFDFAGNEIQIVVHVLKCFAE